MTNNTFDSSFRDKSGYIFKENEEYFRIVKNSYKENYDFLINSGLYKELCRKSYLIDHEEITNLDINDNFYKILKPRQLKFISFPASWSINMLKDAALLTLKIQKIALKYGMILKDASAYNIQFYLGKPIFIDTLSFEIIKKGNPWIAYGQFCRHFLTALALIAYRDINLHKLYLLYLDGIPLEITIKLLPFKTRFNFGLQLHLFLQNKLINDNIKLEKRFKIKFLSEKDLINQATSLMDTIKGLKIESQKTEWDKYYIEDVDNEYLEKKKNTISNYLNKIKPNNILDLGANNGTFSKIAANLAQNVFSFDIDPNAIDNLYQMIKNEGILNIQPLIVDITNPEPGIGWYNKERDSLLNRLKVDTIMALAIIHHLRITGGIPIEKQAEFFQKYCDNLIIEFIPKSDPKIEILLKNREDVFDDYEQNNFEFIFLKYFDLEEKIELLPTNRLLYLFKKR